ncbi:MAG TPA: FecR family protein, partial [Methylomirabilota bacterium]|nr:FecR family protein [Methylomirabilota bacterium]
MTKPRTGALLAGLLLLAPAPAGAQASQGVGVVTTLNGQATVSRASLPQPLPLKFKDEVFERDRIRTGEKSIVRVLLGGKALITVRELSELTVTEEANRSTVRLASGKVAMGVLRSRMKPGDSVEVRTPNAIAAVRGTVFVVEIIRASASSHAGPVPPTTNVYVIRGRVEVLDPANPGAVLASVGAMESFGRTGTAPGQRRALTPAAVAAIFADLTTTPQHTADSLTQEMGQREHARAVALARALTLEVNGTSGPGGSAGSGGSTDGRIAGDPDEDFAICGGGTCQVGGGGSGGSG